MACVSCSIEIFWIHSVAPICLLIFLVLKWNLRCITGWTECLTVWSFCSSLLQLQSFQAEDIKQDYDTGKDGITMVSFKVDFDRVEKLEETIKANCSRELVFYKHWHWLCYLPYTEIVYNYSSFGPTDVGLVCAVYLFSLLRSQSYLHLLSILFGEMPCEISQKLAQETTKFFPA